VPAEKVRKRGGGNQDRVEGQLDPLPPADRADATRLLESAVVPPMGFRRSPVPARKAWEQRCAYE
jgi:hypothetical protein